MSADIKLTVAICTYNRAEILRHCLQSIADAPEGLEHTEILVVDNNSTDHTAAVVEDFQGKIPVLRRLLELAQGHSHARNRAMQEAQSDWIFYLDDDAKIRANPHTFQRSIWMIENHDYQIFGGVYFPWFHYGRPPWFRDHYGSNEKPYQKITELTGIETVSGGIMCINRNLLAKLDGFNPNVGMKGNQIGYWDENELQMRIRRMGYAIAYDPQIQMDHLVAKYKMSPDWYFKASYIKGRDLVMGEKVKGDLLQLFLTAVVAVGMPAVLFWVNFPKLLFRQDYYVENFLIDTFRKSAKRIGVIYTALLRYHGSEPVDK